MLCGVHVYNYVYNQNRVLPFVVFQLGDGVTLISQHLMAAAIPSMAGENMFLLNLKTSLSSREERHW